MRTAFIAMGGNLPSSAGPVQATLAAAATRLDTLGRVVRKSSLYSTEPVGFAGQPRFVNAVVELETALTPRALLTALLVIEHDFGRDRAASFPNGPRTLDLDMLLYDNLILDEPDLQIPHPRLAQRAFVLVPLHEIAPLFLVPGHQKTVAQLLNDLSPDSESTSHAVVPIQAAGWRAGRCGADPYPSRR